MYVYRLSLYKRNILLHRLRSYEHIFDLADIGSFIEISAGKMEVDERQMLINYFWLRTFIMIEIVDEFTGRMQLLYYYGFVTDFIVSRFPNESDNLCMGSFI